MLTVSENKYTVLLLQRNIELIIEDFCDVPVVII